MEHKQLLTYDGLVLPLPLVEFEIEFPAVSNRWRRITSLRTDNCEDGKTTEVEMSKKDISRWEFKYIIEETMVVSAVEDDWKIESFNLAFYIVEIAKFLHLDRTI